jgi:hypothetical protein
MTSGSYVSTQAIHQAVRSHETDVLRALGIRWQDGAPHICCPYPDHSDENPSWRWDARKARAFCTCIMQRGGHSILEIVKRVERIEFEAAKLRVAEILGRTDLIESKGGQRMDAASLLQLPADQRDETLGRRYLAYRLGVPPEAVPMPSTTVVGWRELPYYDPPASKEKKPRLVGRHPCVVFATVAPDGRRHAHRIYVAPAGAGKPELGNGADGRPRDPKKSARLQEGQSATGCAVLWGDPAMAPHLLVAEGIETAAALAFAHQAEITAGDMAVAAALSSSGIRALAPWSATRRVTVAADRDEARPRDDRGYRAGERAAHALALAHHQQLDLRIALPGHAGEDVDWLDVLRSGGIEAVRSGIGRAGRYEPRVHGGATEQPAVFAATADDQARAALDAIATRAAADPAGVFEPDALRALAAARRDDPPRYQRTIGQLKQAGVRMRDLEREVRRASLRVIEGGPGTAATDPALEAGPYFMTRDGMIAWRKETRDGSVPIPLCNFTARIVAEEALDDGAEQRTGFVIEGDLPGGRPLPPTRVPAERYPAMNWVTEAWGTAPVIFAGQGKRDHLRAAIQMLSGSVPRRMIYGHLGWRRIDDCWAYLHSGGAIGAEGAIEGVEVDTGTDSLLCCQLPPPPEGTALADAVRASLAILELGPDTITAAILGAIYRAPLGEASAIDFALHLAGPTGAFKTELAALAQAHFGSAFNGRRLPASWADTANMLEKKAFLAKDAVLVVDDFAPTGTTADVQRLHRDADRLFRAAGNRAGRARMRADGGSRPTYHPRGLIISTGEDIPSGQSLRARLLLLELTPGQIPADRLSAMQCDAASGIFAAATAGYLHWLASRIEDLKGTLSERQRMLRNTLTQSIDHRRMPDIAASLIVGWGTFLQFAEESGAIIRADAGALLARVRAAVTDSAEVQRAHQASEEPARRFLALLGAAISSGRAHLADAATGAQPEDAACWGWQLTSAGSGDLREVWRPNGERLGWIRDRDLLLEPETAFAAAQKLARDQGTSIPIKQRTLWKRLAEQGLLASRDRARGTNTVRHTIEGLRRDLLHVRASVLAAETDQREDETDQHDESDQERGSETRGFPGRGQFGQFGQKIEPRGPKESDLRDAVGWEVEI